MYLHVVGYILLEYIIHGPMDDKKKKIINPRNSLRDLFGCYRNTRRQAGYTMDRRSGGEILYYRCGDR